MIQSGNYLFTGHSFSKDHQPQLALLPEKAEQFYYLQPRSQVLTLVFDTRQRYCTGWHDLASSISYPCPDAARLPSQYHQCRHCQQKTGFNPAFYHAATISKQQTARNAQPHSLYLAHFGPRVIKVGISFARRGINRLLDQGARSGLIIKTFPTAETARKYEAAIARLPGFSEMLQTTFKQNLLKRPHDSAAAGSELQTAREIAAKKVGITPEENQPIHFDKYYFGEHSFVPHKLVDCETSSISGLCMGLIGNTLLCQQDDLHYRLPLGKLTGYTVNLSFTEKPNSSKPRQISLF